MAPRLELHDIFKGILETDQVYFQPPPTVNMKYPCIVYHRDFVQTEKADNGLWIATIRYMVTVIDPNPDSDIPMQVMALPLCTYDRFYTADKLNHDVFKLFF